MKNSILALSTLLGTIIGVGIFGLPYVAGVNGFFVILIFFIILSFIIYLINLMYAEVISFAQKNHQLTGYVEMFFGKKLKHLTLATNIVSYAITLLAYVIVGGSFLHALIGPMLGLPEIFSALIFFGFGIVLILKGMKAVASIETIMLFILILMVALLFILAIPKLHLEYLFTAQKPDGLTPYGIVIFALWGLNIVPEVRQIVKNDSKKLKKILRNGIGLSTLFYIIFVISVLGVSGPDTTPDALSGLAPFLSRNILTFGYIFGILTTFTSFISLGLALMNNFRYDYQLSKKLSWLLASIPPLILLFLGMRDFLHLMEIVGGIFLGIQGLIIFALYKKLKTKKRLKPETALIILPNWIVNMLMIVFMVGIGIEIVASL